MNNRFCVIFTCILIISIIHSSTGLEYKRIEGKTNEAVEVYFEPGSYVKVKLGREIPSAILENDAITGILLDASWGNLEPEEGVYSWGELDERIDEASASRKKISLNIIAGGINTPKWLFNYDIQTFTFIDLNRYHKSYLCNITIPVFWDPIFLGKKIDFIKELGDRYANNICIVSVTVSFANAMTNDWNVPHYIGEVEGVGINQVRDWLNAGYTHEKMLYAGEKTIDTWADAFPNQALKLPLGLTHEDLDGSKTKLAEDICEYTYEKYHNRFFIQLNGLSTKAPYAYDEKVIDASPGDSLYLLKLLAQHSPNIGLQMSAAASNWYKDHCRLNGGSFDYPRNVLFKAVNIGLSYNPCFIEYWEIDGLNSRLKSIIKYATDAMRDGLSIYVEKPSGICFLDKQLFPTETAFVIGEITVRVAVYSKNDVGRVEFYIDNILKFTDYERPYEWLWNEKAIGRHELKVIVYDNKGDEEKYKINIIIFNFGV